MKRLALWFGLPVVLLTIWWFVSLNSTLFYLPPLKSIVERFPEVWTADRLRADVLPSVIRLLTGFTLALILGVGLGLVIGLNRRVRATTEPVLEFFRAIPPPVLVPIIMLFAGIGDGMKVTVIAFGCLWPVLLNTVQGVLSVDPVLLETARTYRIGGVARLRHLVLRAASPQIVAGARQALSLAIILMVISELFAPSNGLGYSVVQFQRRFAVADMWTGILLLGLLGVLLAGGFRLAESRVLRWYHGLRATERES